PGYRIVVKPLRYREKPHLSAWTDFEGKEIVLQVPEPFFSFGEIVPYAAKRRPGKGMRFIWMTEGVTFRTPREVLRFLYLHEWMHWYLKVRLGRGPAAEGGDPASRRLDDDLQGREVPCRKLGLEHGIGRSPGHQHVAPEVAERPGSSGLPGKVLNPLRERAVQQHPGAPVGHERSG